MALVSTSVSKQLRNREEGHSTGTRVRRRGSVVTPVRRLLQELPFLPFLPFQCVSSICGGVVNSPVA